MKYFATSDWHFYHRKMLSGEIGVRPPNYETLILQRYRSTVGEDDIVFILGDLFFQVEKYKAAFASLIRSLPGKKFLVKGNHDKSRLLTNDYLTKDCGFENVSELCIDFKYPIGESTRTDTRYTKERERLKVAFSLTQSQYNVHGHTHEYATQLPCISVSVEQTDYYPYDLGYLLK